MINKTKDYSIFKIREDNRPLTPAHVRLLVNSIKSRNLLEWRPIVVNKKMELIDGQHRLEAAKTLGVDIYYIIQKDMENLDITIMNKQKSWTMDDYLNYYVVNGNENYIRLKTFLKKYNLNLRIGLNIIGGPSHTKKQEFREGKFKFECDYTSTEFEDCWDIIAEIKRLCISPDFLCTGRFWSALLKLVREPNFNLQKMLGNISRMSSKVCVKANTFEYLVMLENIHNFQNRIKVDLSNKEYDDDSN